eukprot:98301-Rhodomonas_salina.4
MWGLLPWFALTPRSALVRAPVVLGAARLVRSRARALLLRSAAPGTAPRCDRSSSPLCLTRVAHTFSQFRGAVRSWALTFLSALARPAPAISARPSLSPSLLPSSAILPPSAPPLSRTLPSRALLFLPSPAPAPSNSLSLFCHPPSFSPLSPSPRSLAPPSISPSKSPPPSLAPPDPSSVPPPENTWSQCNIHQYKPPIWRMQQCHRNA